MAATGRGHCCCWQKLQGSILGNKPQNNKASFNPFIVNLESLVILNEPVLFVCLFFQETQCRKINLFKKCIYTLRKKNTQHVFLL